MSMYGSFEKDYEAWMDSASERGLSDAIADGHEHLIHEAFIAGAASVIGGAGKAKATGHSIETFLASYRNQVNAERKILGV